MIRLLALSGALAATLTAASAQAQPMGPGPMSGPSSGGSMSGGPMSGGPMSGGPMSGGPMSGGRMHPGPVGGALPTPEYIHAAATSDEFEIAASQLAVQRSHNPRVQMFARHMIQDHTQSTAMIKAAIRRSGHMAPPPPPLTPMQDHMLADLRHSGPAFDGVYVDQQVRAHEMALQVHQAYAEGGSDPALRRAAGMIVPVVQSHLRMAHDLQGHRG